MPTALRLVRDLLLGTSLLTAACSASYADRPTGGGGGSALIAEPAARSPYEVTIVREDGGTVDTFAHRGRYYVLGQTGERYTIRVTNPTDARVEAVVTVDGLDVIDGGAGDLGKRGYIVPPRGDLRIEGFRTSTENVATFRFSSVDASYAARKGVPRNVGVIAVAVFAEVAAPEMVEPSAPPTTGYQWERDLDGRWQQPGGGRGDDAPMESRRAPSGAAGKAAAPRDEAQDDGGGAVADRMRLPDPAPPTGPRPPTEPQPKTSRPGLGTEFGEQRYSATRSTRFVRASATPIAIAELRYNDAPGLAALGINVGPAPDSRELTIRETADPFPGERFAQPPR